MPMLEDKTKVPSGIAKQPDAFEEKQKDDAAISLINGLDLLIAFARAFELHSAARMIYSAKESVVLWAADQNFYESNEDRFINKYLMDNSLLILLDMLAKNTSHNPDCVKEMLMSTLRNGSYSPAERTEN